jgi:acyl-CoA thioesterase-2
VTSDLEKLLDYLIVEEIEENVFCGNSPKRPARVFGGQVLAQALNAATKTVSPDRLAHSMHASFLRPGNPGKQIKYEVNLTRDGRSFTTRNVLALQDDVEIFSTSVSFHIEEAGLSHHTDMPQVPPPEELETDFSRWSKLAEEFPDKFDVPTLQPIERRPVNPRDFFNPEPGEPQQKIWFRALGSLNDDLRTHQIVLAYMSDFGLLGTTLMPHPFNGMQKNMQSASLDHALWFHRPFRADEFLLYSLDSPVSAGGRGFSRGSFYTREGLLVASTAQECLIRTVQN